MWGERRSRGGRLYLAKKEKEKKGRLYLAKKEEEEKEKGIPGKARVFSEKFKSVLKAQNGMKAELQVKIRCGGWLT